MSEDKNCTASIPCSVQTLHGLIKGKKCPINKKVYHNTVPDIAGFIAKSGTLKVGQNVGVLGQETLSLSSCPTQGYGGNVKFVLKANKSLKPMCYYEWKENRETDKGIDLEAHSKSVAGETLGLNRVRAKYSVQLSMYDKECEYVSNKNISLKKNLEKIEFWIPWKIGKNEYSHGCEGVSPNYANVHPGDETGIKVLKEQIEQVNGVANKLGVPFEVKSCFSLLKASWGDRYIPLTDENLKKFEKGITPEVETIPDRTIDWKKQCKC